MARMLPHKKWAETDVHKASTYSCAKCGKGFRSPQEVYKHLDLKHPASKGRVSAAR